MSKIMSLTFASLLALSGVAMGYANFLSDPNMRGVQDWRRAAAVSAAAAAATSTRGSQSNPTDPCFNFYAIPSPTPNPSGPGPDGTMGRGYQPPGTNDVRSPCPALNTLANHGYLPRNGRGINGSTLVSAFLNGWGVGESVISIPISNALAICTFQSGGSENGAAPKQCDNFDLNVLNTPHEFEHDHSLSRRDYEENTQNGPSNNHLFDPVVFNKSLAVLNSSCYMTTSQANEVRLQRESQQFTIDKPFWFTLAPGVQETEIGFIFSVMKDFTLSDYLTNPLVRVSWWQYWFSYESFPTPLGWAPPNPIVTNAFVTSVSSVVQNAKITSTPSPFFSEFVFGPTGTFPSTSTAGKQFFNPTLPNLYTGTAVAKRFVAEATPTAATI